MDGWIDGYTQYVHRLCIFIANMINKIEPNLFQPPKKIRLKMLQDGSGRIFFISNDPPSPPCTPPPAPSTSSCTRQLLLHLPPPPALDTSSCTHHLLLLLLFLENILLGCRGFSLAAVPLVATRTCHLQVHPFLFPFIPPQTEPPSPPLYGALSLFRFHPRDSESTSLPAVAAQSVSWVSAGHRLPAAHNESKSGLTF